MVSSFLFTLHLADNALILGHRNSEWTGHGPILEQDIAISNIALDLIGQARNFYQYAAAQMNVDRESLGSWVSAPSFGQIKGPVEEDDLAYLRDVPEFRNNLLVEQTNGDWAKTVLRQFFFSAYQQVLYEGLQNSPDEKWAAIAGKSLKEVRYHLRWSGEWVIRLGDGTEESHRRMGEALSALWPFTGELFMPAAYEQELYRLGMIPDLEVRYKDWKQLVQENLAEATLEMPAGSWMQAGGKEGRHTEHLGFLLAEMQYLQRAYPQNQW